MLPDVVKINYQSLKLFYHKFKESIDCLDNNAQLRLLTHI